MEAIITGGKVDSWRRFGPGEGIPIAARPSSSTERKKVETLLGLISCPINIGATTTEKEKEESTTFSILFREMTTAAAREDIHREKCLRSDHFSWLRRHQQRGKGCSENFSNIL